MRLSTRFSLLFDIDFLLSSVFDFLLQTPREIHGRNRTWINKDYRTNRAYSTLPYEFPVETKIAMLTAFSGLLSAVYSRIYGCSAMSQFAENVSLAWSPKETSREFRETGREFRE